MEPPCFVEDIFLPHMLYAVTIRSPVAKGRLESIECPKLPHNYMLVSAKDIPGANSIENSDLPLLASEELSYIGEPVALLLGPDRDLLEEYAGNCRVIAGEEEPVFSLSEAAIEATSEGVAVLAKREIQIGDTETAFAEAASVVQGTYSTGIQEHWYAEPTGALAWIEQPEDGRGKTGKRKKQGKNLFVRTATQWPYHVRRSVAGVLGLSAASVLVHPTTTGLHMDGKFWYPSLVACHAALGAWIAGKPVRLVLTRAEDFAFSPKRCGSEIHIAGALDAKGEITGMKINAAVNMGAYGVNAAEVIDQCCLGSLGFYKTKNISFTGTAYKTNLPPQGPFAGFGLAQGFFAMERHISNVADSFGQDPAVWRALNFAKGRTFPVGLPDKDTAPPERLLDIAVKMSDYSRKWAAYELLRRNRRQSLRQSLPQNYSQKRQRLQDAGVLAEKETLRGIGVAMGCQGGGLLYPGADKGAGAVELVLSPGGLEIRTSVAASTAGGDALWAGIAREILEVDESSVRVNCGPSSPDAGPDTASRGITVLAKLVEQACASLQKQRFRTPLPITVRKTARPAAGKNFTTENTEEREKNIKTPWSSVVDSSDVFQDCGVFLRSGRASAVVEAEIDPVEYTPRVRGVWLAVDGGKIISEVDARAKLKNSVVQALGWAYRERVSYVNGAIPPECFEGFNIFELSEIPPIHIEFVQDSSDEPKGIGDLPFSCVPAAYLQAVSQAIDNCFHSVPVSAEDVWEASGKLKIKGDTQL